MYVRPRRINCLGLVHVLQHGKGCIQLIDTFDSEVWAEGGKQIEVEPTFGELNREPSNARSMSQWRAQRRKLDMRRIPVVVDRTPLKPRANGHAVLRPVHAKSVLAVNRKLPQRGAPVADSCEWIARDYLGPLPCFDGNLGSRQTMLGAKIVTLLRRLFVT